MTDFTQLQMQALEQMLRGLSYPLLAYSGGLDSRFLAYTLLRLNIPFTPVHITGPHVSPGETEYAISWLRQCSIPYTVISSDPLEIAEVAANGRQRCYFCKRHLFSSIIAQKNGDRPLIDGTNASDLSEYRPGRQALKELGVISPLASCTITKEAIHILAVQTGLDNPTQVARPCLLTRFAYNLTPEKKILTALGKCEDALSSLGLLGFRLRIPAAGEAMLQIPQSQKKVAQEQEQAIYNILQLYGFPHAIISFPSVVSGCYDAPSTDNRS